MSTSALNLLRSLDLLDATDKPANLARLSDQDLRTALNSYFAARVASFGHEARSEASGQGELSTLRSSVSCENGVSDLLPSTLVYRRTFTNDPLFREAREPSAHAQASQQSLGMRPQPRLNRVNIAQALAYFGSLAPLIRERAVCVLPLERLHAPDEELPVFFSPDGFASAVPENIRAAVTDATLIHEVVPSEQHDGLIVLPSAPSGPVRGISVEFAKDRRQGGQLFFLYDITKAEIVGEGIIQIQQALDWGKAPDTGMYTAWVQQSVNKTILNRLAAVSTEMQLAEGLGAVYLTESEFEANLFALAAEKERPADSRATAVNFLHANSPFLDVSSPEAIVRLRRNNPTLFEKFQASLLYVSSQLTGAREDFEEKARQLYVKEIEPQIQALNGQLSKVLYQLAASGVLSIAAFGLALLKAPAIPFSVMLAVAGGGAILQSIGGTLPSISEYLQKRKTPAYIWSRISKES